MGGLLREKWEEQSEGGKPVSGKRLGMKTPAQPAPRAFPESLVSGWASFGRNYARSLEMGKGMGGGGGWTEIGEIMGKASTVLTLLP